MLIDYYLGSGDKVLDSHPPCRVMYWELLGQHLLEDEAVSLEPEVSVSSSLAVLPLALDPLSPPQTPASCSGRVPGLPSVPKQAPVDGFSFVTSCPYFYPL